jgi:hypothetical protein
MLMLVDPFEAVGIFAAIGGTLLVLYGGFVGVWWFQRKIVDPKLPEPNDLERVHERLARLEECELRLAEVEERLDFTERMLAQARPDGALPPGRA